MIKLIDSPLKKETYTLTRVMGGHIPGPGSGTLWTINHTLGKKPDLINIYNTTPGHPAGIGPGAILMSYACLWNGEGSNMCAGLYFNSISDTQVSLYICEYWDIGYSITYGADLYTIL